jgi:hypothetical protein
MPKFRKKPVIIEARRVPLWDERDNTLKYVDEIVALAAWCGGISHLMDPPPEFQEGIHIPTLIGTEVAQPGDWIIRGVQGEFSPCRFYPCKPDIFEAIYERVDSVEGRPYPIE